MTSDWAADRGGARHTRGFAIGDRDQDLRRRTTTIPKHSTADPRPLTRIANNHWPTANALPRDGCAGPESYLPTALSWMLATGRVAKNVFRTPANSQEANEHCSDCRSSYSAPITGTSYSKGNDHQGKPKR